MKIKVTSLTQERISFGRALIRWLCNALVAFLYVIAIVIFTLVVCFLIAILCSATKLPIGDVAEYFFQQHLAIFILAISLTVFMAIFTGFCLLFVRFCRAKTQTIQDYLSDTYQLSRINSNN